MSWNGDGIYYDDLLWIQMNVRLKYSLKWLTKSPDNGPRDIWHRELQTYVQGGPKKWPAADNAGLVFDKLLTSRKKSVRRLSSELNISTSTVQRLLKDLGARSYQIQILQSLTPNDEVTCFGPLSLAPLYTNIVYWNYHVTQNDKCTWKYILTTPVCWSNFVAQFHGENSSTIHAALWQYV
jgi:hypothetical protein